MSDEPGFMRTRDAAAYCALSARTLEAFRSKGGGPAYLKPPGRRLVRYRREDLDAWLCAGRRTSTTGSEARRLA